jgi:hypothetical protein
VIDGRDFACASRSELGRDSAQLRTERDDRHRLAAGQLLPGGDGFPRGAIELAAPLFSNDEDHRNDSSSR